MFHPPSPLSLWDNLFGLRSRADCDILFMESEPNFKYTAPALALDRLCKNCFHGNIKAMKLSHFCMTHFDFYSPFNEAYKADADVKF